MMLATKTRIMEIVGQHRGKPNAITRNELAFRLRHYCIDLSDRKIREAYSTLPICSCQEGLFRPVLTSEVEEYQAYLLPKVGPIIADRKCRMIYATYPELVPRRGQQIQLELGVAVPL